MGGNRRNSEISRGNIAHFGYLIKLFNFAIYRIKLVSEESADNSAHDGIKYRHVARIVHAERVVQKGVFSGRKSGYYNETRAMFAT